MRMFAWFLIVLLVLLSSCAESHVPIPTGGYDYTLSDGMLLGYPIPMVGINPMHLTSDTKTAQLSAFYYDEASGEFSRADVVTRTLHVGDETAAVFAARRDADAESTCFATDFGDGFVYEGNIDGKTVVHMRDALFLADEIASLQIAADVAAVYDIDGTTDSVLYGKTNGGLYLYCVRGGTSDTRKISGDGHVSDAWLVSLDDHLYTDGTMYGDSAADEQNAITALFCEDGDWKYLEENGDVSLCVLPSDLTEDDRCVFLRGTSCMLYGSNTVSYIASAADGSSYDMDMGGLYRFRGDRVVSADNVVLSSDGIFVYFYDVDFIYRFNLVTGTLDLAPNEAPMFENTCLINSMTPATDEIIILSQSAAEHTEFVATITIAAFEEDLPETREEEKIDLEPRR